MTYFLIAFVGSMVVSFGMLLIDRYIVRNFQTSIVGLPSLYYLCMLILCYFLGLNYNGVAFPLFGGFMLSAIIYAGVFAYLVKNAKSDSDSETNYEEDEELRRGWTSADNCSRHR